MTKLNRLAFAVAKALEDANEIRSDLSGRYGPPRSRPEEDAGTLLYCVVEKGQFSTIPTIEANTTPIEGTAEGVIV